MGKKNKNKKPNNNIAMIVGVSTVGVIALYFASSYSGLIGTKLFTGGSTEVKTSLECSWSQDNTFEAKLSVSGVTNNPAALDVGKNLGEQRILFIIPQSSETTSPAESVTDEQGIARTKFTPVTGVATPVITALYPGSIIQIDTRADTDDAELTTYTVEYDQASCEIANPNL